MHRGDRAGAERKGQVVRLARRIETEAFHSLLMTHMGYDSATAYAHEGISGMNGRTDAAEYFKIPLSTLNQKIKRLNVEVKKRVRD